MATMKENQNPSPKISKWWSLVVIMGVLGGVFFLGTQDEGRVHVLQSVLWKLSLASAIGAFLVVQYVQVPSTGAKVAVAAFAWGMFWMLGYALLVLWIQKNKSSPLESVTPIVMLQNKVAKGQCRYRAHFALHGEFVSHCLSKKEYENASAAKENDVKVLYGTHDLGVVVLRVQVMQKTPK